MWIQKPAKRYSLIMNEWIINCFWKRSIYLRLVTSHLQCNTLITHHIQTACHISLAVQPSNNAPYTDGVSYLTCSTTL
jgi:hypothetical protein